MRETNPIDYDLPLVLVADEDPDWRALAELHVRLTPGVRLLGAVTTLPQVMDVTLAAEPDVILVGLGRPEQMEQVDLSLLRMLAPETPLIVASVHGADDARERSGGIDAWFVDKIEVLDLVQAISDAAGVLAPGGVGHPSGGFGPAAG